MPPEHSFATLLAEIIAAQTHSTIVFADLLERAGIDSMDEITQAMEGSNVDSGRGINAIVESVIDALRENAIKRRAGGIACSSP